MIAFAPAKREAIRLLLGVAGGTGSGKTYSGLRLARGLSGEDRFAVIDTENGRASMYADEFSFDVAPLGPPFKPSKYAEAIQAAEAKGYGVIMVDSTSHSWTGEGGVLEWHDELERGDASRKMLAWQEPKKDHRTFENALLQVRAHVILCFRASPKVEMKRNAETGRMEVVPKQRIAGGSLDGWIPESDPRLPYELTASFLLMADAPGIPKPIKLPHALAPYVSLDSPLSEDVGRALGVWAAGDDTPVPTEPPAQSPPGEGSGTPPRPSGPEHSLGADLDRVFYAVQGSLSLEQILAKFPRVAEVQTLPFRWEKVRDSLTQTEAEAMLSRLSDYREKLEAKQ